MWRQFKHYTYGPTSKNAFYLHLPKQSGKRPKLALLVHGGNFLYGSATDASMIPLAHFFLERGYAVATIDYRPLTTHTWPTPVKDVAQGIQAVQKIVGETDETVFVGFSAGAVTGSLLLYSEDFPTVTGIDRFIGLSGLYSKAAVAEDPIEAIRYESLERVNLLNIVREIRTPKMRVPALLVEGSRDYFADRYPHTDRSHARSLEKLLTQHHIPAQTHWTASETFSGHEGPILAMASQDSNLIDALEKFLTPKHVKAAIQEPILKK
jgi:acetyl esterase/lipase